MKKFRELNLYPIEADLEKYLAHKDNDKSENLFQHIESTKERFVSLCENGGLEDILDMQIKKVFKGNYDDVKELILNIVSYHDLGKLNPAFQKDKMKNRSFSNWNGGDSSHSKYGWILFLSLWKNNIDKLQDDNDYAIALILTTVMAGHHTYAWGRPTSESGCLPTSEEIEYAYKIAESAGLNIGTIDSIKWISNQEKWDKGFRKCIFNENVFALYKTLYSALILCDAIATGALNSKRPYSFFYASRDDIKKWRANFLDYQKKFIGQNKSSKEIDIIRKQIYEEAEYNLKKGLKNKTRLYYLEAPTGSGKTNCSINLALTVLENDPSIKRMFFVFPFINIIEQNAKIVKESLGASENDILEVHSLAEGYSGNDDEDYKAELDQRLFLDGKIIITSSVNFFEALGSSLKNHNYKICSISNSVVIIDEIQGIDDRLWPYIHFLLDTFAKENNCYFIVMSATLPRIDKIEENREIQSFMELIENPAKFSKNSIFSKRTKIVIREDVISNEELISLVRHILFLRQDDTKLLIVVNTIRRAKELFKELPLEFETKNGKRIFKKMLLTSELLPHRKLEVINAAKSSEAEYSNLIVVSTQCIEAGVDADFDIGIRDLALPDSIEQVSGRINRNGLKKDSLLYVVNLKRNNELDADKIYGESRRWNSITATTPILYEIIKEKDYTKYYNKVIEYIKLRNRAPDISKVKGRDEVENARKLRLFKLKDFRLIDNQHTESWFIPINLPKNIFSEQSLKYIKKYIPNAFCGDEICGEGIWKEYERIIKLKGIEGIIRMARFTPILSKFIANKNSKNRNTDSKLLRKLENKNEYSIEEGFIDDASDGFF